MFTFFGVNVEPWRHSQTLLKIRTIDWGREIRLITGIFKKQGKKSETGKVQTPEAEIVFDSGWME
jgi:hypothetical protein